MKKTLATLTSAVLLAACGGEDSGSTNTDTWNAGSQSLVYSYPAKGQTEIATPAPVILRFTSAVNSSSAQSHITLHEGNRNGASLSYTLREIDNGRGLVLTPDTRLTPLSRYTVVVDGLPLVDGDTDSHVFSFTTRALEEGPRSQVLASSDFSLSRLVPDGQALPVMDFSTLRLQFSQPLDPASVQYGNDSTDTLTLSGPGGELVEARVLVDGPYLTLDPTSDLTPGQNYTLTLASGLASTAGNALAADSYTLTPKDSRPREVMVQKVSDSANRALLSPLTGLPINEVPINATLLGDDNATQQGGDVHAELAFVPNYPEVTPFTVPRSTVLAGTSIDVNIGGEVPAGFSTGAVNVHFLSDASGYLLPNPYTQRADAPRQVRLFMDVAMSTEDPTANGGVTQDILHIELVGTALVVDGIMTIDAVSMVEPNILGLERGYGTLSFHMEAYRDQLNPPEQVADTTPPELQSWMPGDNATQQKPGEPIVLTFSEPLERSTLAGNIVLQKDGLDMPFQFQVDGASVVIQPDEPLDYSEYQPGVPAPIYTLALNSQITDLADNPLTAENLQFELAERIPTRMIQVEQYSDQLEEVPVPKTSPLVLSTYPGYPCVTDASTRDLANDIAGRCQGGSPGYTDGKPIDQIPADDLLPVMPLPANHPVAAQFSKAIAPESVVLGQSFQVHEITDDGSILEMVPGKVKVSSKSLTFWPDMPWKPGVLYRYQMASNNVTEPTPVNSAYTYLGSSEATCDGTGAICSQDGMPLLTQPLGEQTRAPNPPFPSGGINIADFLLTATPYFQDAGGPHLEVFFRGEDSTHNVLQSLAAASSADINNNLMTEAAVAMGLPPTINGTPGFEFDSEGIALGSDYISLVTAEPVGEEPFPQQTQDGIEQLPNSARITSLNVAGSETPAALDGATQDFLQNVFFQFIIDGGNVGCGYEAIIDSDGNRYTNIADAPPVDFASAVDDPAAPVDFSSTPEGHKGDPIECMEKQFTNLHVALNAVVTEEYDPDKGVKVLIFPAQIFGSSVPIYARSLKVGSSFLGIPTGMQILRMRYAEDSEGNRTKPITGWIHPGENGPELSANIDLYMDIPYVDGILQGVTLGNNIHSYPISMSLNGPIDFLNDGRMLIKQFNQNTVNVDFKNFFSFGGTSMGGVPLSIPEKGSYMQLISSPIKNIH